MPTTPPTRRPLTRAEALARADQLLAKMTLDEKLQQMVGVMAVSLMGADGPSAAAMERLLAAGVGHIAGATFLGHQGPGEIAKGANAVQRYLVEQTRLGIPAIIHSEALNGAVLPGHPVYPTAIGLAATWDPEAVRAMAAQVREQLRAVGVRQALSPVMDVARDARWGRIHETYGEDPYLISAFAVAYTRGMQGDDLAAGVIATAKHFLGYGAGEGGQNAAASVIAPRELAEVYARPFQAAIRDAGLGSVMNSYSSYDGVPIVASPDVLRTLLREKLGFAGTVVSDYAAVQNLVGIQEVAADAAEAGLLALRAGLDVELPVPYGYGADLLERIAGAPHDLARIDDAARNVLADKFQLGLFDQPYVPGEPTVLADSRADTDALAARLAAESVTLLANDGGVPPIPASATRIAVIGPHAADVDFQFPAYTYPASLNMMRAMMQGSASNMAGIDAAAEMIGPDAIAGMMGTLAPILMASPDDFVRGEYGAQSLSEALTKLLPHATIDVVPTGLLDSEPTDLDAVRAAASSADFVVLALGGRPGWFGKNLTEGEGSDTADIDLPAGQRGVIEAVAQAGVAAAAVVYTGRPFALTELAARIPAIVWAPYGGQQGNQAVAAALTGAANPAGRLPYSIPRHSGQVPIHASQHPGSGYRKQPTNTNLDYLDLPATPLYPFGHGLSYTAFDYSELVLDAAAVGTEGRVTATVSVTNSGERSGEEVVQFYAHDRATGVTRPAQQLVGFQRVALRPGQRAVVQLALDLAQLAYLGLDGTWVVEPGDLELMVGASSDDLRSRATVTVTGSARAVHPEQRVFLSQTTARVEPHAASD